MLLKSNNIINLGSSKQSTNCTLLLFESFVVTFRALCGTKLDHSEMLRLVRPPIYLFTVSPPRTIQHAQHQPTEVLQLAPGSKACLQTSCHSKEKITIPLAKTHHRLFIHMPGSKHQCSAGKDFAKQ